MSTISIHNMMKRCLLRQVYLKSAKTSITLLNHLHVVHVQKSKGKIKSKSQNHHLNIGYKTFSRNSTLHKTYHMKFSKKIKPATNAIFIPFMTERAHRKKYNISFIKRMRPSNHWRRKYKAIWKTVYLYRTWFRYHSLVPLY